MCEPGGNQHPFNTSKCYKKSCLFTEQSKGHNLVRHYNHKIASDDLQDKSHHPGCPKYLGMWVSFKVGVSQGALQKPMSVLSGRRPTDSKPQRIPRNKWPRKKNSWPWARIKKKKKKGSRTSSGTNLLLAVMCWNCLELAWNGLWEPSMMFSGILRASLA